MNPDTYLRRNLVITCVGITGFLATAWYIMACFLLTIHNQLPHDSSIPLLSGLASLPSLVYQYTSYPILNLAWRYAIEMPSGSEGLELNHGILIGTALASGLFAALSGEYLKARATVRQYEHEIEQEKLREGVRTKNGYINKPSDPKEDFIISLQPHKPWHEKWWGKLFVIVVGGLLLAICLQIFGLK
ncbi:hypothetical protein [Alloalcanivorax xenomutans]|jgi:hypothetical protein|uniref:hypothetical protein n=1 Tax=Alloalcanivorax xenomutans TaxID=1094342 RepID=UPI0012DDCAC9